MFLSSNRYASKTKSTSASKGQILQILRLSDKHSTYYYIRTLRELRKLGQRAGDTAVGLTGMRHFRVGSEQGLEIVRRR